MKKKLILLTCIFFLIFLPLNISILTEDSTHNKLSKITIYYKQNQATISIDFETYLIGVVAACMPAGYELEALKAQAVIARTYAIYNIQHLDGFKKQAYYAESLSLPFLNLSELKYVWGEEYYLSYYSKIENAVYATKGEIMTYQEKVILPMFFHSGCGQTRNAAELFGQNYPYLSSVDIPEDYSSTDYMTLINYTKEQIIDKLYEYDQKLLIAKDTFFRDLYIYERDSSNYVLSMMANQTLISGEAFAKLFNLTSSHFTMEEYEHKIRFICIGKGHGIGLSQYGANEMAKKNSLYQEILCHFYLNIKFDNI